MLAITATYKQWRRAYLSALKHSRGMLRKRGSVSRLQLACELRERREYFANRRGRASDYRTVISRSS